MNNWTIIDLGKILKSLKNKSIYQNQFPVLTSSRSGLFRQSDYFKKIVASKNNTGYKIIKKGQFTYRSMSDDGFFKFNRLKNICEGIISPAYEVFEIDENIADSTFIEYLLNSRIISSQIYFSAQGGTRLALRFSSLEKFKVNLPPLSEQKKIAEIISRIEKNIDGTVSEKIRIEITRRSLIQQLTRGLNFKGKRKSSGTEFGLIPTHWNCEPLPKCCKLENNNRKPIKAEDRKKMRGKYPYHGATKIQDYISEYSYEGNYTLIGEDGDHFSKYNSWEMAQYASGKFNVSNHAHVIGGTSSCNSKWLYYSLLHRDLTLYLTRQGATRFKLSKASLEEVPVLIPPINEQLKMINIFDNFSNLINALEKKIIKLSVLKEGISSELLSGRKRVKI